MNHNPLLSICIPTYNRAPFLKQCLDSVVCQFNKKDIFRQAEIVISDNGSSDDTEELVKSYQNQWPNIRYFKNRENLGFDRNVLNAVDKARGEYCWLLGDDDALFENSLKSAFEEIKRSRCDYYMANFWAYDGELAKPVLDYPNWKLASNLKYERFADFVKTINNYKQLLGLCGGMSVQIFRREIWRDFPDKSRFIGSECVHSSILQIVMKDRSFMILKEPLVKARSGNMRWETFPGLMTAKQRIIKCRQGLFWTLNHFDMPASRWKIDLFLIGDAVWGLLREWCKRHLAAYPNSYAFVSKIYKKLFVR